MASCPWGWLLECTGKSAAMQRDFSATAQSSQKPAQPVRQIPAVFQGLGGSGTRAKFRRKGLPSSAVVCQVRELRPCVLSRHHVPVSHPGSAVSVSWAGVNHSSRDEGCLQQDLLLWKPLALQGKSRPVVMQSASGTTGHQPGAPKIIPSFTIRRGTKLQ